MPTSLSWYWTKFRGFEEEEVWKIERVRTWMVGCGQ